MKSYDLVIAGGAMAGATLALTLAQLRPGLSLAVVESYQPDNQSHPGFDSRAIALSYGSVRLLKKAGLWEEIAPGATAIEHIHVSDRGHAGMAELTPESVGADALGYVVELADIGRGYHRRLQQAGIDYYCPDSVTQLVQEREHVCLTLGSGETLNTRLVVAADGADSLCCREAGLVLAEHDFGQVAVIANVRCEFPHHNRAFERFTPSGPVALLPMSDQRMSLVWCVSPSRAEHLLALEDDGFINELQQAFGWRLGRITQSGSRASYPLLLRYRPDVAGHRVVAVGNAAQTLHPIAGQGFNLGIRDVMSLCDTLAECQDDCGSYAVTAAYRDRREQDRNLTMAMTSGLVSLFSCQDLSLALPRNLGLMALDSCLGLKLPLMQRTMGMVER